MLSEIDSDGNSAQNKCVKNAGPPSCCNEPMSKTSEAILKAISMCVNDNEKKAVGDFCRQVKWPELEKNAELNTLRLNVISLRLQKIEHDLNDMLEKINDVESRVDVLIKTMDQEKYDYEDIYSETSFDQRVIYEDPDWGSRASSTVTVRYEYGLHNQNIPQIAQPHIQYPESTYEPSIGEPGFDRQRFQPYNVNSNLERNDDVIQAPIQFENDYYYYVTNFISKTME